MELNKPEPNGRTDEWTVAFLELQVGANKSELKMKSNIVTTFEKLA